MPESALDGIVTTGGYAAGGAALVFGIGLKLWGMFSQTRNGVAADEAKTEQNRFVFERLKEVEAKNEALNVRMLGMATEQANLASRLAAALNERDDALQKKRDSEFELGVAKAKLTQMEVLYAEQANQVQDLFQKVTQLEKDKESLTKMCQNAEHKIDGILKSAPGGPHNRRRDDSLDHTFPGNTEIGGGS